MTDFQIYPAVDLKDGNCVRLLHGKENDMTIYEVDPIKQVNFFFKNGFKWVHIVDLNAAFGKQDNKKIVLKILKTFKKNIKIQLGGGIRSIEDIKFWIDAGVSRIVLGTFAFKNPDLINNLSDSFSKKLALGLDIKNKKIAINGWTKLLEIDPIKYVNQIDKKYFDKVIYTDISKDGTLKGANILQTKKFAKSINIPIIASGGISNINNVKALHKQKEIGISGVIIGKAIYEKKFDLKNLVKIIGRSKLLSKRVIPCLDVHDGRTVKGINFVDLIDAGDPVEQAKLYNDLGADEICFLDISATNEGRKIIFNIVSKVAESCFIPLTVGGGIKDNSDINDLLKSGADKVSINSAAVFNSNLINEASDNFGCQCIVLAIDAYKDYNNSKSGYSVSTHGGKKKTNIDALEWAIEGEKNGAGEILLTSMNADGTKLGYDIELTSKISAEVSVPVIASGGAGKPIDMVNVLKNGKASAVLAASIFHFGIYSIENVKKEMLKYNIPIRKTW